MESLGVPATRLSDEELEQQRAKARATRDWALHRGSDEEYQRHSLRTLELEQEYLRRQLRQQALGWKAILDEATRLGSGLRSLIVELEARLDEQATQVSTVPAPPPAAVASAVASIMANGSWSPDPGEPEPALPSHRPRRKGSRWKVWAQPAADDVGRGAARSSATVDWDAVADVALPPSCAGPAGRSPSDSSHDGLLFEDLDLAGHVRGGRGVLECRFSGCVL